MEYVSPRQLARAAGVSESSVKRWCDQGLIPTVKTAGGHRRVTREAATEFLRKHNAEVRPELLGLPVRSGSSDRTQRESLDDFLAGLMAGDEERCRRILFDRHMAGERASRLCDSLLAPSLFRIGEGWQCGEVEVYQERRACGICSRLVHELTQVTPAAPADAPLAIGGAPECDPYELPTAMVALVLRQIGWRAESLGSRLPLSTLAAAVHDSQPRLLWMSVSLIEDEPRFVEDYRRFRELIPSDQLIVVGGRALHEGLRRELEYTAYCEDLQHFDALAQTLLQAAVRATPQEPVRTVVTAVPRFGRRSS